MKWSSCILQNIPAGMHVHKNHNDMIARNLITAKLMFIKFK